MSQAEKSAPLAARVLSTRVRNPALFGLSTRTVGRSPSARSPATRTRVIRSGPVTIPSGLGLNFRARTTSSPDTTRPQMV